MAVLGIPELPVTEVTPEALLSLQRTRASERSACRAAVACRPPPTSRSSTRRCCTTPPASGTPTCSPTPRPACATCYPDWLGTPANRTLGLVLAGDDGRVEPARHGPDGLGAGTFGHNGAGGQIAWADPATGLSFVYLTNGMDQHLLRAGPPHDRDREPRRELRRRSRDRARALQTSGTQTYYCRTGSLHGVVQTGGTRVNVDVRKIGIWMVVVGGAAMSVGLVADAVRTRRRPDARVAGRGSSTCRASRMRCSSAASASRSSACSRFCSATASTEPGRSASPSAGASSRSARRSPRCC